jgi:hypothetical protein
VDALEIVKFGFNVFFSTALVFIALTELYLKIKRSSKED